MNLDFLAGCLCGAFIIPALVRLLVTGRLDGWSRAPRRMPPIGETVLAWMPGIATLKAVTYNGPDGGGSIPETAELYWRPMPPLPRLVRRVRGNGS
jgi:hypothetical protein